MKNEPGNMYKESEVSDKSHFQ